MDHQPRLPTHIVGLPTELLLEIIYSIPSLVEALPLLWTCRRFREIWTENATAIYRQLISDPCPSHALVLLRDQEGAAIGDVNLTASNVVRLSRNLQYAQKAVEQFEDDVNASRIQVPQDSYRDLTATERLRFIRAYYQCWSLMKLKPVDRYERLSAMTMRQLYFLADVAMSNARFGEEEVGLAFCVSPQRKMVRREVWNMITVKYGDIHECDIGAVEKAHGSGSCALFDNVQRFLKWTIFVGDPSKTGFSPEFVRRHLWDDSDGEP